MCGDLEPEDRLEGDLYQRFLVHSRALLEQPLARGDLNRYLDELFHGVLQRCVADNEQVASPNAYRQMAMQSLVLARLAGFLAGHVGLNEDPMRKVMEALMHGYHEAEHPPQRDHHGHDHGAAHGHDHGHDDGRGHHHGHGHDQDHGRRHAHHVHDPGHDHDHDHDRDPANGRGHAHHGEHRHHHGH